MNESAPIVEKLARSLSNAEQHRLSGEHSKALEICESILEKYPDYSGALQCKGLSLYEMGKNTEALACLSTAYIYTPTDTTLSMALANCLRGSNKTFSALTFALQANKAVPNNFSAKFILADCWNGIKNHAKEFQTLQRMSPQERSNCMLAYFDSAFNLSDFKVAADILEGYLLDRDITDGIAQSILRLPKHHISNAMFSHLKKFIKTKINDDSFDKFMIARFYELCEDDVEADNWYERANSEQFEARKEDAQEELDSYRARIEWIQNNKSTLGKVADSRADFHTTLCIIGPSRSGKTTIESNLAKEKRIVRGFESPILQEAARNTYNKNGWAPNNSLVYMHKALLGEFIDEYARLSEFYNVRSKQNYNLTLTMPGLMWDLPFFIENVPNIKCYKTNRSRNDVAKDIYRRKYKTEYNFSYDMSMVNEYLDLFYEYVDNLTDIWPSIFVQESSIR